MRLIEQLGILRAPILDSLQTQVDFLILLLHTQFWKRFWHEILHSLYCVWGSESTYCDSSTALPKQANRQGTLSYSNCWGWNRFMKISVFTYLYILFPSSFFPPSCNLLMQVYSFVEFLLHFLSNYFIFFNFTCQNTWANSLCGDLPLLLSLQWQDAATACLQSLCHGNNLGIFTYTKAEKTNPDWNALNRFSSALRCCQTRNLSCPQTWSFHTFLLWVAKCLMFRI